MKKRLSLQQSLFRNLALGPILLGLTILATSILATHQLRETVAAELTGRVISEVDAAFAAYLGPVDEIIELSVEIGRSGAFASKSPEELDATFSAMLQAVTQVTSVHVAKSTGEEYMLLRNPDGHYSGRLASPETPGWITTREWTGKPAPADPAATERVRSDYAPAKRVWFTEALGALERADAGAPYNHPVWSDPYTFFTTKEHGITASIAYRTPSGEAEILAFDILLTDILEFAKRTRIRNSGIIFVLLRHAKQEDIVVLAIPAGKLSGADAQIPTEFPVPVSWLAGAPRAFVNEVFDSGSPESDRALRFRSDGENWWGAAARSPLSDEKEIWIAATIPETEVLEGIPDTSKITLAALLVTIGIMVARARYLARRYGDPIGKLVEQTERIGRLNFTRELVIESPIHEVQTLASSQDAMRRSLEALAGMNDRGTIARELRTLPAAMLGSTAGQWEIALFDEPKDSGGGCFPMVFAARSGATGTWSLAEAPPAPGAVIVLAATQLRGMQAAQHAPALRATARALLHLATAPSPLLAAIREELVLGAGVTAPVQVLGAYVDGSDNSVEFVRDGRFAILHWQASSATPQWLENRQPTPDKDHESETLRISLEPADLVVIAAATLFDVLDCHRHRLRPSDVEAWVAASCKSSAAATAAHLGQCLHQFASVENLDADIALFVIAPMSREDGPDRPDPLRDVGGGGGDRLA